MFQNLRNKRLGLTPTSHSAAGVDALQAPKTSGGGVRGPENGIWSWWGWRTRTETLLCGKGGQKLRRDKQRFPWISDLRTFLQWSIPSLLAEQRHNCLLWYTHKLVGTYFEISFLRVPLNYLSTVPSTQFNVGLFSGCLPEASSSFELLDCTATYTL